MGPAATFEAPPAPPPPAAEPPKPKEVKEITSSRRKKDIGKLTSNLLCRKAKTSESETVPSEGQQAIRAALKLREGQIPDEESLKKGNPITIAKERQTHLGGTEKINYSVVKIISSDGGNFTCDLEDQAGRITTDTLPIQDVANAMLLSESDKVLGVFSGDQQEIIRLYLANLKDPQGELPKEADELIKRTALSDAGLPTIDHILALQQTVEAQVQGEVDPEKQAQSKALVEELQKLRIDGNILDQTELKAVFTKIGITPQKLGEDLATWQTNLEVALDAYKANPTVEARKKIAEAQNQVLILGKAQEALKDDGPFNKFISEAEKGNVDLEIAKSFWENLSKGDYTKLLSGLPETENMTDEEKAELQKAFKFKGALGILALLSLYGLGIFKGVLSPQ